MSATRQRNFCTPVHARPAEQVLRITMSRGKMKRIDAMDASLPTGKEIGPLR